MARPGANSVGVELEDEVAVVMADIIVAGALGFGQGTSRCQQLPPISGWMAAVQPAPGAEKMGFSLARPKGHLSVGVNRL